MKKKSQKDKKKSDFVLPDLLWISAIAFVLIVSSAFALNKAREAKYEENQETETITKTFTPIPLLVGESNFPVISARSALAVDLDSGVNLYDKNSEQAFLPASTTKIVTALVALDYYGQDQVLEVINPRVEGRKMGLVVGEKITAGDLLHALLILSANDAAEVLAQNYPGGREGFIMVMNNKAKELGVSNTSFTNPAGLDGGAHLTTAEDLIRVSKVAMQDDRFKKIVGTQEYLVQSIDGEFKHKLVNTNELLGKVDGVLGVKTGWTEDARENLVTYVERDNKKIMVAMLASQDRFGETEELIEWVFDNYEWQEVKYESQGSVTQ